MRPCGTVSTMMQMLTDNISFRHSHIFCLVTIPKCYQQHAVIIWCLYAIAIIKIKIHNYHTLISSKASSNFLIAVWLLVSRFYHNYVQYGVHEFFSFQWQPGMMGTPAKRCRKRLYLESYESPQTPRQSTPKQRYFTPGSASSTQSTPRRSRSEKERLEEICDLIGFTATAYLSGLMHHVPDGFPNRVEYIHSILSATYPNLTIKCLTDCIHLINGCPDFLQIKPELTSLLKRAEPPIMEFLMPQIENCYRDHCQGSLYSSNDVTAVTVYDVSGPREALKTSLRCRECDARYHITNYSIDGKQYFYPKGKQTRFVAASSKSLISKTLHELFSESAWVLQLLHFCIVSKLLNKIMVIY